MPRAESSIDWDGSVTLTLRAVEVDPQTWDGSDELGTVVGAGVSRDSSTPLVESGSLTLEGVGLPDEETWVRIEALAVQDGAFERHPVATLLMQPAPTTVRRGTESMTMDGCSVLAPAADRVLLAGESVSALADAAGAAAGLIAECTPAPVSADGSFRLAEPMVFAAGTSHLEAAQQLVDAAGWCIQVECDGSVHVRPKPTTAAVEIGPQTVGTSVEVGRADGVRPNRYIAVDGTQMATAVLGDPERYVDEYDDAPKPVGGESLKEYAERMLAERNAYSGTRGYSRPWVPGITVHDLAHGAVPAAMLDGDMRIARQSLEFGKGITVNEECEVLA